jgi:hypothetical protein
MPLDKRVEFEELALAALKNLVPSDSSRASAVASISWYLRRDAEVQAIRCPDDQQWQSTKSVRRLGQALARHNNPRHESFWAACHGAALLDHDS